MMFEVADPHATCAAGERARAPRISPSTEPLADIAREPGERERAGVAPDDPLARSLARAVRQRGEAPVALLQRYRGNAKWAPIVADFEAAYTTLPDALKLPEYLEQRLSALERFTKDGRIEDSSAVVVPRLRDALSRLAAALPADDDARQVVAERVTDLLVATCLVVARGTNRRIEVMTPDTLQRHLLSLAIELRGRKPFGETAIGTIGAGKTLAEDMLLLNLLNMLPKARAEILSSTLFDAIRASDRIDDVMLASSGHEEQHYLSTCGIASRDQEILTHVGSIAGLICVGRHVLAAAGTKLDRNKAALRKRNSFQAVGDAPELMEWVSVYDMCAGTIADAGAELSSIEQDALAILQRSRSCTGDLEGLTDRWAKVMQRAVVILAPAANPDAPLSLLTTKYFGGHWHTSAFAAALVEGLGIFLRGEADARQEPPDAGQYSMLLTSELYPFQQHAGTTIRRTRDEWKDARVLTRLWETTVWYGGVPLGVPGHALYLKAVRQDGQQLFLLGEPKASAYQRHTGEQLAGWIAYYDEVSLPFDPFDSA